MAGEEPQKGDEVAWNWGSSHIEGEVAEKKEGKITKEIKGKPITKNGEPDNPAYFVKQTKKKGMHRSVFCVQAARQALPLRALYFHAISWNSHLKHIESYILC